MAIILGKIVHFDFRLLAGDRLVVSSQPFGLDTSGAGSSPIGNHLHPEDSRGLTLLLLEIVTFGP